MSKSRAVTMVLVAAFILMVIGAAAVHREKACNDLYQLAELGIGSEIRRNWAGYCYVSHSAGVSTGAASMDQGLPPPPSRR